MKVFWAYVKALSLKIKSFGHISDKPKKRGDPKNMESQGIYGQPPLNHCTAKNFHFFKCIKILVEKLLPYDDVFVHVEDIRIQDASHRPC